jgi:hypothetical protein
MNKKIVSCFSILLLITTTTISYATTQTSDTNLNISDNQPTGSLYVYTPGDYLIKTEWGQWGLYNDLCPDNDTRPSPKEERLGCWSVAIGQIMNFYQSETHSDSDGFNPDYMCSLNWIEPQHITNDLDDFNFDWPKMVNKLTSSSSPDEEDNVQRLLYDTATIIQKDFGTGNYFTIEDDSVLDDLIYELKTHFSRIMDSTAWDNGLTEDEIKTEINDCRPIMFYMKTQPLSFGVKMAHAVVIDGWQYNWSAGGRFEVHLNYGWSGLNNGWHWYYGEFPGDVGEPPYDNTDFRKGLKIRVAMYPDKPHTPYNLYTIKYKGQSNPYKTYTDKSGIPFDPSVEYRWDWGDGTLSEWLNGYDEGEEWTKQHIFWEEGTYNIRVRAKNSHDLKSIWSDYLTIEVIGPPEINTDISSLIGTEHQAFIMTTSNLKPPVQYRWDWGDGTKTDWLGPFILGETCRTSHQWKAPGVYDVRVQIKNRLGEGDWSPPQTVHMVRSESLLPILDLLIEIKENIPIVEPILMLLIRLICK